MTAATNARAKNATDGRNSQARASGKCPPAGLSCLFAQPVAKLPLAV